MSEHLSIRCLEYRLLLPGCSVHSIRALGEGDFAPAGTRSLPRRLRLACPRLDLRRLLNPGRLPSSGPCAGIHWVSEDGDQNAFLVVDAVDRILHCHDEELRPLPALPRSLGVLCDGLLREADGRVLIRVRADAIWPMPTRHEKRHFIDALIRLCPEADEGLPRILP